MTFQILLDNIFRVHITCASHHPPSPNEMYLQIKYFYQEMQNRNDLNPIELAAWTHAEFVRIHSFPDGNGRTSRLIMNYQLMKSGFLPVNIRTEDRIRYYSCLDRYASGNDLSSFSELIAELEEKRIDSYLSIVFGE